MCSPQRAQGSRLDTKELTKLLSGQSVLRITQQDFGGIAIHFANGSILTVKRSTEGVAATLQEFDTPADRADSGPQPTRRQREYLEFMKRYTLRFGVAPAESDIQRHFMVSAPSVNQMVKTLERGGFIKRGRDLFTGQALPRSIRILVDV